MRLALICPSRSNGGLELTAYRLGCAVQQRGIDVLIAAPTESPLAENAMRDGIPCAPFEPRCKYGDLKAVRELGDALRTFDATHGVLFRSQDIHIAALAHRRLPNIQWTFYQQMQSAVNKRDLIHRWMFSRLSSWFTLTERMREDVIRCTTMPGDRVFVVPLGRDMNAFDPSRYDRTLAKTALGLPLDRIVIGMIGRLDPQKGQEDFLHAASIVRSQHPEAFFVIAGEDPRYEQGFGTSLRTLADELGLKDHVAFLPHTTEVAQILASFDLFVMPSHSETYGLVLIEAMAMQKPVVATDAGGVPELARHTQESLLVPPKDPQRLGEAITTLLRDHVLASQLATNARVRAVERFSEERCVSQFLNALFNAHPSA